ASTTASDASVGAVGLKADAVDLVDTAVQQPDLEDRRPVTAVPVGQHHLLQDELTSADQLRAPERVVADGLKRRVAVKDHGKETALVRYAITHVRTGLRKRSRRVTARECDDLARDDRLCVGHGIFGTQWPAGENCQCQDDRYE